MLNPQPFDLSPQHSANLSGNIHVRSDAATGVYSLTQVAGALITDLTVASDNASLWLRFDEEPSPGIYPDDSGRVPPQPGSCAGTCTLDAAGGRVGGGLKLNGSGYLESGATVSDAAFSVSLWFKVAGSNAASGTLFASEDTVRTRIYLNGGRICSESLSSKPGVVQASCDDRQVGDDVWHHLVVADGGYQGGGGLTIYLDGSEAATGSAPCQSSGPASAVLIGGKSGVNFFGSLDDLRLFERVLTATEVAELANQPLFHMDFNTSSRWQDVSPYHLTIRSSADRRPHMTLRASPAQQPASMAAHVSQLGPSLPAGPKRRDTSRCQPGSSPRLHGDSRDAFPQGILGLNSGELDAYPTLQRVGQEDPLRHGRCIRVERYLHVDQRRAERQRVEPRRGQRC